MNQKLFFGMSFKFRASALWGIISLLLFVSCNVQKSLKDRPNISNTTQIDTTRIKHSNSYYTLGNNSLKKNKYGIWEMYIEGKPLERGFAIGSLTRELIKKQETAFFNRIDMLINSDGYLKFLSKVVAWFNRKMYLYVPEEYKKEIYGISRYGNHQYDDFAKPYVRFLYYHGAHDIGHALQDLMLVGCTSFAVWDQNTADGKLLLGRNFDFYAGDDFAKEKIIAFIDPSEGYKFMSYTWPGMIGVVSGMNVKGLTVTINSAKSKIPLKAKTPISLLTREILQYAKNIEEAIAIAKRMEVFVSESIMVGSSIDKRAVIIEVSPKKMDVYRVNNSSTLICSNHFQGDAFLENPRNQQAILNGTTEFRYERMQQLLNNSKKLTPKDAAKILRERKGLDGIRLGMGNERAINQLLAHHGIIFKPEEHLVWVSANPYNMGEFVAYDLDDVFSSFSTLSKKDLTLSKSNLLIPEDPFIHTKSFKNYEEFRTMYRHFSRKISNGQEISVDKLHYFKSLNPYYWKTYAIIGKYYYEKKQFKKAVIEFKQALNREITNLPDKRMLKKYVKKCYRKM